MTHRRISRRDFLKSVAIGGLATVAVGYGVERYLAAQESLVPRRPTSLGTTFSQLQCRYLGLDYKEVLVAVRSIGFEYVRLCTYWDEIEATKGEYDFSVIDWLLSESERAAWEIILCVGMKTPRWPEFHFPNWVKEKYDTTRTDIPLDRIPGLSDEALRYIEKVIQHAKASPKIAYWQIENEPLNQAPVADLRYLSHEFLQTEIGIARSLIDAKQKILFTFGVDPPFAMQHAPELIAPILQDVNAIGFDVYAKVPTGIGLIEYLEATPLFWWNIDNWRQFVVQSRRDAWIAESQAEPWEPNKLVAVGNREYPSSDPKRAIELASRLCALGFNPILLWGCEHWYWHKSRGNLEWWDAIETYVRMHA